MVSVISHLDLREASQMACTCSWLRLVCTMVRQSDLVLPLGPTVNMELSNHSQVLDIDTKAQTVRKNMKPGISFVLGKEPVSTCSTYWEIRLDQFTSHRCEIGVAVRPVVTSCGFNKSYTWVFDCFGHVTANYVSQEYGGKMRTGDMVGVLYDAAADTLSFFDNGRCMGVAFEGLIGQHKGAYGPLFPIVILEKPEEQVTLQAGAAGWCPAPHPDDGKLIIGSRWGTFRCKLVPGMTVGALKNTLAPQCGYPASQLALRSAGRELSSEGAELAALGIDFGRYGVQRQEVVVYVPHEVS